jgi:hypothetical protein
MGEAVLDGSGSFPGDFQPGGFAALAAVIRAKAEMTGSER